MKYLKIYENYSSKLDMLADHITQFMKKYEKNVNYTYHSDDVAFYYTVNEVQNKYFFNIRGIYKLLIFDKDIIIQNPGWINENIKNMTDFVIHIFNKYVVNNKLDKSNIESIIKDINSYNYDVYMYSLKYNL